MKMGRLMVVLCLFVVGVGCGTKGEETENRAGIKEGAVEDECPINKVTRWAPNKPEANPKQPVKAGQTIFVFAKNKALRANMANSASADRVVPLNELRDGNETLWYGVAPKDCWSKDTSGDGVEIKCVKCSTNLKNNPQLSEPCCLNH